MIDACFLHLGGIGPGTAARLAAAGYADWAACLADPQGLPLGGRRRASFLEGLRASQEALAAGDAGFFTSRLPGPEQWRVLAAWFGETLFFDIETTGLVSRSARVSAIAAWSAATGLETFDTPAGYGFFLERARTARLLSTFNGACFDIPFLEDNFHVPSLGAPHVDLRWMAYHQGYAGGLKALERAFAITRPPDLAGLSGEDALLLYEARERGDTAAGKLLLRYCAADTLGSVLLAERLLVEQGLALPLHEPERFFLDTLPSL